MPLFRFCLGLSDLRLSFSSARGPLNPVRNQSVARMPHVKSFLLRCTSGGFLTGRARNKVFRVLVWMT